MKSFLRTIVLAAATLLLIYGGSASEARAQSADASAVAEIQALQKQYVASIDAADIHLVDNVWSHAPEVVFIEPRGTEHGIEQVKDFVSGTFGKIFSKRDLILENPAIHVYGDSAWSDMTWTFHATVRGNGQEITTKGRESQIYHKENGGWRIVAVHYSGPAITSNLKGF
jgi:ketosteroid isomerase-like protein